jgi:glutaredoxin
MRPFVTVTDKAEVATEVLAPSGQDSTELREAIAKLDAHLYTTPWCGYCKKARAFLSAQGVPYHEHDIDSDPQAAQRHRLLNPKGSVPVLDLEGVVVIGFGDESYASALARGVERRTGRPVEIRRQ